MHCSFANPPQFCEGKRQKLLRFQQVATAIRIAALTKAVKSTNSHNYDQTSTIGEQNIKQAGVIHFISISIFIFNQTLT